MNSETYTIYYKRFVFWKKITGVLEDGFIIDRFKSYAINHSMRFFILDDKTVLEIPATCEFRFPPKRHRIVEEKKMQEEMRRMKGS